MLRHQCGLRLDVRPSLWLTDYIAQPAAVCNNVMIIPHRWTGSTAGKVLKLNESERLPDGSAPGAQFQFHRPIMAKAAAIRIAPLEIK
jgi:hypothetical protein